MPTQHLFEAVVSWSGAAHGPTGSYETYSREFTVAMEGKPDLVGSAALPFRGDPALHNPEDLLLAAVSGCHLLSYLALASRRGLLVSAYRDVCEAKMAFRDGRMRIVEATLNPVVVLAQGSDLDLAASLHQEAHDVCFIANSVNFEILVAPEFVLA